MLLTSKVVTFAFTSFVIGAPLYSIGYSESQLGTTTVKNNCGWEIFYGVYASSAGPTEIIAAGQSWSYGLQSTQSGRAGISIKIANTRDGVIMKPLQFEYTVNEAFSMVWYDVSAIDGDGGFGGNWTLAPLYIDSTSPTCVTVNATNTYRIRGDDRNSQTKSCSKSNSLTLSIC